MQLYRQIIGAANEFKEGDHALGLSAANPAVESICQTIVEQHPSGRSTTEPVSFRTILYDLIQNDHKPTGQTFSNLDFGAAKIFPFIPGRGSYQIDHAGTEQRCDRLRSQADEQ
jgi:hypothetical protein